MEYAIYSYLIKNNVGGCKGGTPLLILRYQLFNNYSRYVLTYINKVLT